MFHRNTEESSFWYQMVSQIGTAVQTKGQKLRLSGFCFKRIAQLCEIEVEPNYFPWSQFVNLLLSICLVHLWDYLDSATYVVPCLVIYQERIVSTSQHQLGSKKSSNHGGHGQKAPAHLGDRPTELICITNINTRDDLLSPEYQAVSSVFLNVISHRGKNDEHSSNLLFPLECTREHKW